MDSWPPHYWGVSEESSSLEQLEFFGKKKGNRSNTNIWRTSLTSFLGGSNGNSGGCQLVAQLLVITSVSKATTGGGDTSSIFYRCNFTNGLRAFFSLIVRLKKKTVRTWRPQFITPLRNSARIISAVSFAILGQCEKKNPKSARILTKVLQ